MAFAILRRTRGLPPILCPNLVTFPAISMPMRHRPLFRDFSLPAGRYELMINSQPYDFAVAGAVTDPGHCVEGSQTMRGPVFYECRRD